MLNDEYEPTGMNERGEAHLTSIVPDSFTPTTILSRLVDTSTRARIETIYKSMIVLDRVENI